MKQFSSRFALILNIQSTLNPFIKMPRTQDIEWLQAMEHAATHKLQNIGLKQVQVSVERIFRKLQLILSSDHPGEF